MARNLASRRAGIGLLLLALLALTIILKSWSEAPTGAAVARDPAEPVTGRRPGAIHVAPVPALLVPPLPAAGPPPARPVIDAIEVEKPVVCSGEDNLVTVRAHTVDGTDGLLHYSIGTRTGARALVRVVRRSDSTSEMPLVRVFGRGNMVAEAPVPSFRVEDCPARPAVLVTARQLPNTEAMFEFAARLLPEIRPPRVASYLWSFDGGDEVRTDVPRVEHELTPAADQLYTTFLVKVSARTDVAGTLEGRSTVTIQNKAYQNWVERGVVMISATGVPLFPIMDDRGVVRQSVRLRHAYPAAVRITSITETDEMVPSSPGAMPPLPVRRPARLGVSSLGRGESIEVAVALDTVHEPGVFSRTYELEGITADGRPARGAFSLMRPPARPDRDHHVPVTNPALVRKILLARKILGRRYVTDEDIFRLQAEGRLTERVP